MSHQVENIARFVLCNQMAMNQNYLIYCTNNERMLYVQYIDYKDRLKKNRYLKSYQEEIFSKNMTVNFFELIFYW